MIYLKILQQLSQGKLLTSQELELLLKQELANPYQAEAFNITPKNGLEKISLRSQLFQDVYSKVKDLCHVLKFQDAQQILNNLWKLWLPLAIQLIEEKHQQKRPLIQGILGGQGTGKTTLSTIVCLILEDLDYLTISISIDDLYKTYQERQQLKAIDPRLIWRGPPGTHDINLGIEVLDKLKNIDSNQPILIPRFDKSLENGEGDRIQPGLINRADIVLFEGWFVAGVGT
ncbi:hypothetical protein [Aphanothece sacrum]|uniref:ABC transporter ATP-binding protein n=1 Tax=Aphanothece sacrum FPU1 TaxID=1920663 RepID=A0A401IKF2_APHSA|nr:hypothetical protein [Aphanothece sacrum]GBF81601.1 ABC transporter ATP-binding protein [Aphanothece sacrum FPU1]GBF84141.1 ABC transporter ATP-binding protein [Aphanothece sacrum FPU3]